MFFHTVAQALDPAPIDDPSGSLPQKSTASFIGITVAICGNIIISLALNCQKLAHKRLELQRQKPAQLDDTEHTGVAHRANGGTRSRSDSEDSGLERAAQALLLETEPLMHSAESSEAYGTIADHGHKLSRMDKRSRSRLGLRRFFAAPRRSSESRITAAVMPVEVTYVDTTPPRPDSHAAGNNNEPREDVQNGGYLRSKLWWLGFLLMNVGELGNFISYGFAPASVVAPLGTFALIANCLFAPLMLGEQFQKCDLLGVFLAILGAITVVLSANPSDVRLDADGLLRALGQKAFIGLASVYAGGAAVLVALSRGRLGREWVYVDVGAGALFGGFTVLSTKALSTLITTEWWEIFTEWIAYPLVVILIGTGIGQIKHLNRALMKFDSKVVIPTQFVLFNLSAIIGSAVLYGDFRKTTFHQMVTFLYGCGATFAGVFLLTWGSAGGAGGVAADAEEEGARPVPVLAPAPPSAPRRVVRLRRSTLSLLGISPAQRLLLVGTSAATSRSPSRDTERVGLLA